jgi:hypothetical protein
MITTCSMLEGAPVSGHAFGALPPPLLDPFDVLAPALPRPPVPDESLPALHAAAKLTTAAPIP